MFIKASDHGKQNKTTTESKLKTNLQKKSVFTAGTQERGRQGGDRTNNYLRIIATN